MPSSIYSHQAPGLALKVKFPKKIDGTAISLGTFVPDITVLFEFFFTVDLRWLSHSLIGQLIWTVPLAVLTTLLFCRVIAPFCAKIASRNSLIFGPLRYFGIDEWKHLKNKKLSKKFWVVAVYSAIIGGITHLLLDLPSHGDIHIFFPWIVWQSPDFLLYTLVDFGMIPMGSYQAHAQLTVYDLIWLIESLITLLISLYYLRYIKTRNLIEKWYENSH
jgi:hypothetical protein